MIPWILGLVRSVGARTWALILAAAGVALALFSVHRSGKRAGRQEVETEVMKETIENVETRKKVEDDIRRSDSTAADQLRDRWNRDKRLRVD